MASRTQPGAVHGTTAGGGGGGGGAPQHPEVHAGAHAAGQIPSTRTISSSTRTNSSNALSPYSWKKISVLLTQLN